MVSKPTEKITTEVQILQCDIDSLLKVHVRSSSPISAVAFLKALRTEYCRIVVTT